MRIFLEFFQKVPLTSQWLGTFFFGNMANFLPQKHHWQPAAVETFSFLLSPAFTKHLSLLKLILVGIFCMMQKVGIETKQTR
jgi:hypothetical protein